MVIAISFAAAIALQALIMDWVIPSMINALDDRFHETGRHGTGDVFVDSPFGFD